MPYMSAAITHAAPCFFQAASERIVIVSPGLPSTVGDVHSSQVTAASAESSTVRTERAGMVIDADTPLGPMHVETPMVGAHNVDNLLLAAACLLSSRRVPVPSVEALGAALSAARGAPGRPRRDPRQRAR